MYEPVLWGPFAAIYFAVEKGPDVHTDYTSPTHQQIINLLDAKKVLETVLHFDMKLDLQVKIYSLLSAKFGIGQI